MRRDETRDGTKQHAQLTTL